MYPGNIFIVIFGVPGHVWEDICCNQQPVNYELLLNNKWPPWDQQLLTPKHPLGHCPAPGNPSMPRDWKFGECGRGANSCGGMRVVACCCWWLLLVAWTSPCGPPLFCCWGYWNAGHKIQYKHFSISIAVLWLSRDVNDKALKLELVMVVRPWNDMYG